MTADTWMVETEHRVLGEPDEVFEYFVDPVKYRRWKGEEAELDARPGGIYKVTMGPEVWVRGEYLEVDRPNRIRLTWGFESAGPPLPAGLRQVPPGSSTVEFSFVADGDGTIIRVRHTGLPSEEAKWAHGQGWAAYLPRLEIVTRGEDPGPNPVVALGRVMTAHGEEGRER